MNCCACTLSAKVREALATANERIKTRIRFSFRDCESGYLLYETLACSKSQGNPLYIELGPRRVRARAPSVVCSSPAPTEVDADDVTVTDSAFEPLQIAANRELLGQGVGKAGLVADDLGVDRRVVADRHFNVADDPFRERVLIVARELRNTALESAAQDLVGGCERQRFKDRDGCRSNAGPDVFVVHQVVAGLQIDGHRTGVESARDDEIGLARFRLTGLCGPDRPAPSVGTDAGVEGGGGPFGEDRSLVRIEKSRSEASADVEARTASLLRECRCCGDDGEDRNGKSERVAHVTYPSVIGLRLNEPR